MEELVAKCFQIISAVGMARTCFVQSMELAREGAFEEAEQKIGEGNDSLVNGHTEHAALVQQEASGDHVEMNLFVAHAEDQLMSAETCRIMAKELIHVYRKMEKLNGGGR